jgi:pimeloyl-ACP methyl ester carboxylesterase
MMILLFIFFICYCNGKEITPKEITLPDSGITIEYATHGKSGLNPPIIALHGFLGSWYSYFLLMQSMPKVLIYTISLPCYGGSTKDTAIASNFDSIAEIVIEFMDTLDIESAFIMGHSMGSIISQRIAILYPNRVAGIITVGTIGSLALNSDLIDILDLFEYQGSQVFNLLPDDSYPVDFIRAAMGPTTLDLVPEFFFNKSVEETAKVPFKCWLAGINEMKNFNQLDDLQSLELPFVIIYGSLDFIPWDSEKGGAESVVLNVPDVTLYKFHNLGHAPHQEDPEITADIIGTFIKSIL